MDRRIPTLEEQVADIEQQIKKLHNIQRVGKQSLKNYKTASDDLYDWSNTTSVYSKIFRLTFTFDTARSGAIIRLALFYRVDNQDVMASPQGVSSTAPSLQFMIMSEDVTDTAMTWQIRLLNNTQLGTFPETLTAYVKFFFDGTDSGTWTMTQL